MADKPTLLQEAFMEAVRPSARGRAETPADGQLDIPCRLDQQWLGYWGEQPSGIACGDLSEALVSLACIHEHVDEVRICSGCAVDMQQAAGQITCKRCRDVGERHACYMTVAINWDNGEKTTVQEACRG